MEEGRGGGIVIDVRDAFVLVFVAVIGTRGKGKLVKLA